MFSTIKLACPQCQRRHQLQTKFLGRGITCVHCRHSFKPQVELPCTLCRRSLHLGLETLGHDVSCEHCGQRFLAEIRMRCPLCPNRIKILPEFIGHRITCKECKQTIRATLTEGRIVVSRVSPESQLQPIIARESECRAGSEHQRPATAEFVTESQVEMAVAGGYSVQDPMYPHPGKSSSSQDTLPEALALRDPMEDKSAEGEDLRAQLALVQVRASRTEDLLKALQAQQEEIDRLQAELTKSQTQNEEDLAAQVKEMALGWQREERASWSEEVEKLRQVLEKTTLHSERRSRLLSALEKAQSKHEHLRAARETAQQEAEALRARVKELECALAHANISRADAQATIARNSEEGCARAAAELHAQHARSELKQENLLRKEEEFRTAVAMLEADRQRLLLQADALRARSDHECRALKDEVNQLREHAARLAIERDTALENMDSLSSAQNGLTEKAQAAAQARREAEDRLNAEVVNLKHALQAAREETNDTARQLIDVTQQLCAEQRYGEKQRQSEQERTQELVALEEKLKFAQAEAEEEKKQNIARNLGSAEDYALLKAEARRLAEANELLRVENNRLNSGSTERDRFHDELINQVQDLETRLEQEKLRAASLHQELGSSKISVEAEQKRQAAQWTEERTRLQTEARDGQNLLATAMQVFDQERKALHGELERLQQEVGSLRLEREEFRGRLTDLDQETSKLTLQCEDLRVSRQDAEQRWQIEVTRLSRVAQEAQQDLHELQMELDRQRQLEAVQRSELATLRQEREIAQQEAAAARKEFATVREVLERERLALTGELEELRQQLLRLNSETDKALSTAEVQSAEANSPAPAGSFERASDNLDAHMPVEVARHSDFAKRIETHAAELRRKNTTRGATWRLHWGLAVIGGPLRHFWNRPVKTPEDSQNGKEGKPSV